MRRKFRLWLLGVLAACSVVCALAAAVSVPCPARIARLHGQTLVRADVRFGSIEVLYQRSTLEEDWVAPAWRVDRLSNGPLMRLVLAPPAWHFMFLRMHGRWHDFPGGGIYAKASFPLWVPTVAFGLWPGVVAVRALRRRRREQARGFEVTPARS